MALKSRQMKKTILVLLLVLTINSIRSQCQSNFTYSVDPINSFKLTFTSISTFPAGSFAFEQKWYVYANMVDSLNTTTVITFTAAGTYKIKLFVKACVGGGVFTQDDTIMFVNVVDLSTGISEKEKLSIFSLYPNPSSTGNITLKRETSTTDNYSISNINGQVLKTGTLTENLETIDINDLASGMYFVSSGNKTAKFLKN